MEVTFRNLPALLNARDPTLLLENLRRIFAALVQPDADDTFLLKCIGPISQKLEGNGPVPGRLGFAAFPQACFAAGLVPTMFAVARAVDARVCGMNGSLAGFHAVECVRHLGPLGTPAQRRQCRDQILEQDGFAYALHKLNNDRLIINRHMCANFLRSCFEELYVPERMSAAEVADAIAACCQFTLAGPDVFVAQLRAGAPTAWQSSMMLGEHGVPAAISRKYVKRWYAMAQENAVWALQACLYTSPPRPARFNLEVVQERPEIIDLLVQCSQVKRPAWYPETQVDSLAAETLSQLFYLPHSMILGCSAALPSSPVQTEVEDEEEAVIELLKIFVSRDDWAGKIVAMWKKVEDEQWQDVKKMFQRVEQDWYAQSPPDLESQLIYFEYRGATVISLLRLIALFACFADACGVGDHALAQLLLLAHRGTNGMRPLPSMYSTSPRVQHEFLERSLEIFRIPIHAATTGETVEHVAWLAEETVAAPLAYFRVLAALARRGVGARLAAGGAWPAGWAGVTPGELRAASRPAEVAAAVRASVERVAARRAIGRERLTDPEDGVEYAAFTYASAAELALAVLDLDAAGDGQWTADAAGARKEAVLCVGNAAQMMARLGKWRPSLVWATRALELAEHAGPREVEAQYVEKNRARVEAARLHLKA